jgi:hypothetical protein
MREVFQHLNLLKLFFIYAGRRKSRDILVEFRRDASDKFAYQL